MIPLPAVPIFRFPFLTTTSLLDPSNANTTNNDTTAPPTLISFDNVGMNSGRQAQYQTENPAYQIPARPSSLKIKFFEDGLGTNQSNMGAIIADFVITLKFVYYDPIKTTLNLGNQYDPKDPFGLLK